MAVTSTDSELRGYNNVKEKSQPGHQGTGEGEPSLYHSRLFPHSTSSSSCFPSWLPISFPMVSGTGATDTYFPPLNASRGSSCPQRASRKYFSTVTLLQSAAITYRARGREEKQHFLRGRMKTRDIVSCRAHENCVKVTGEGGSMSNKSMYGGKQGPRSSEGRKSPGLALGHPWGSRQPQDQWQLPSGLVLFFY